MPYTAILHEFRGPNLSPLLAWQQSSLSTLHIFLSYAHKSRNCNVFNAIHLAVIATVHYKLSTKIKDFIVILALYNIS